MVKYSYDIPGVLAWMKTKSPKTVYVFESGENCVVGQFLKDQKDNPDLEKEKETDWRIREFKSGYAYIFGDIATYHKLLNVIPKERTYALTVKRIEDHLNGIGN